MHRLTYEEGLAVFQYIQAHPKASTASLVKKFRASSSTIGRIRKKTWKPHPNAKPSKAYLRAPATTPRTWAPASPAAFTIPADKLETNLSELQAALGLVNQTAAACGFTVTVSLGPKG